MYPTCDVFLEKCSSLQTFFDRPQQVRLCRIWDSLSTRNYLLAVDKTKVAKY